MSNRIDYEVKRNGKVVVALDDGDGYKLVEVNTPKQQEIEQTELEKYAKKHRLKGLKLEVTHREYKFSHNWYNQHGYPIPVFKPTKPQSGSNKLKENESHE